ncbi:MAG: sensor histidine kinase [Phototrophicaceae bacterium]
MGSNTIHVYDMIPAALCVILEGRIVYGNRAFRTLSGYALNSHHLPEARKVFHDLPTPDLNAEPKRRDATSLHTVDGKNLRVDLTVAAGCWKNKAAHIVTVTSSNSKSPPAGHQPNDDALAALPERLMATMSHEFRTPLSLIMTSVDMLDRYADRLTPQRRNQRLQEIRVQVNRLTSMLDDINFIIREQTETHFHPVRLALTPLIHDIVERFRQQALPFQRVEVEAECQDCEALIDSDLLERALYNLLLNAMQYGSPLDDIRILVRCVDADVLIDVIDSGDGIPPDEQPHVFEAFYRGKNNELEGSGLGLSIARHCVQLHEGSISLSSVPGETIFTIRLTNAAAD